MRFPLALLSIAPLVCAQQNQTPNQPQTPEPQHETVVVTGTAEPTPLDEADRDVDVLPLPAKQRPLFDTWFDLLGLDPALDLQERAPGGFLADLSIRGGTFGQTLVLLDGMRLDDAQTGHFNLDLPIPIEMISSVEVLKGSGSTLYGSDAIGGVVNVRTEPFEAPQLRLFGGAGNFGTNEEHGIADFGTPQYPEELGFARDFSDGFTTDRDYRNLRSELSQHVQMEAGAGSLLLAYSDRPYGADQFYGPYPSWERIKTWFLSAHQNLGDKTEASFAYRRHTDLFVLFRDDPQIYTNRHVLDTWQGDLRRHDNLPLHAVLSYGAEGLNETSTARIWASIAVRGQRLCVLRSALGPHAFRFRPGFAKRFTGRDRWRPALRSAARPGCFAIQAARRGEPRVPSAELHRPLLFGPRRPGQSEPEARKRHQL